MNARPVDFLTFFILWAKVQGWVVPLLHVRICIWLDTCTEPERVLMVFRGASKSTTYAVYKAYRLYKDRSHRSLVWSADGETAKMLTADVINVLRNHPLCLGMLGARKPAAKRFSVMGNRDARNASMRAVGVDTNATGARADAIDYDDIEVPGNIETTQAREKLRRRIGESTHIATPGAQKTYIGTPHTSDSIYPERIKAGAALLKIRLFEHSLRFTETEGRTRYEFPHEIGDDGLYVMAGIHTPARMLEEGVDYQWDGRAVVFARPPGVTIDIASVCAWPERFTRAELAKRRKETKTFNEWDSQYMLEAKPLGEIRLDPDKLRPYDVEPVLKYANGEAALWLGTLRLAGASCRWDPSAGKLKSDKSSLAIIFQDEQGRRYWHRAERLTGEIAVFDTTGKLIVGGQVLQLVGIIRKFSIPRVTIETNGIGVFAPAVLKAALKQGKVACGVSEETAVQNKNKRILEAIEPPLTSGTLWAHTSVIEGGAYEQMRDWSPAVKDQPDDDLDALAGAITETPERIGRAGLNAPTVTRDDWRPSGGVFEVELEA